MIPYAMIWQVIQKMQRAYTTPYTLGRKYAPDTGYEKQAQEWMEMKDKFLFATLEMADELQLIMNQINTDVDFTYRYKEDNSIKVKVKRQIHTRQLYKVCNDIFGMRFIIRTDPGQLREIAQEFCAYSSYEKEKYALNDYTEGKAYGDGYQGIHVNIRPDNSQIPVEMQFWTRGHALLNEYLHDNIYKIDDEELNAYAKELRDWLERVPFVDRNVTSYVDYIYEKAFASNLENEGVGFGE